MRILSLIDLITRRMSRTGTTGGMTRAPVLFDAVMFGIKSLLEEGQVECLCPPIEECASEDEMPDYDIAVSDDHVKLFCRRCGASVDLPIDDPSFARRFLEADHLKYSPR